MATRAVHRRPPARRVRSATRKAHYSFPELEALWIAGGGNPRKAQLAAAIAMAESRGATAAKSANPSGGTNRGPWQVDDVSHPGTPDPTRDILGYTRAVVKISKNGTDWSQWQTFAEGTYKPFLTGEAPSKSLLEKLASGPLGDAAALIEKPLQPLEVIAQFFAGATELLLTPEGIRRFAKIIIGGTILLWSLNQLSKSVLNVNPAGSVKSAASKAATVAVLK